MYCFGIQLSCRCANRAEAAVLTPLGDCIRTTLHALSTEKVNVYGVRSFVRFRCIPALFIYYRVTRDSSHELPFAGSALGGAATHCRTGAGRNTTATPSNVVAAPTAW